MILINAGKCLVGKKKLSPHGTLVKNKAPFTNLAAFYIDRTEITVTQFRKYQPNYDEKPYAGGEDCPDCPAMGINWIQASKYCRWAGKRLPREEEWEAAARGVTNFSYPWGEVFLPHRSNLLGEEDGHLFSAPHSAYHEHLFIFWACNPLTPGTFPKGARGKRIEKKVPVVGALGRAFSQRCSWYAYWRGNRSHTGTF